MIEKINKIETLVVRFLKNQPSIAITIIVLVFQLLLSIVVGGTAPVGKSMSDMISWEINSLRFLFIPAIIALYIKSALYLTLDTRDEKGEIRSGKPVYIIVAILIVLALDNIVFAVIPTLLNYTICLAVFQRALVIYSITATVFTWFALVFLRISHNPFAAIPILFVLYAETEYFITRLGFLMTDWYFFNDVYIWNLLFPLIKSPMMGDLDAPQVYELVFIALIAIVVGVALISVFYKNKPGTT